MLRVRDGEIEPMAFDEQMPLGMFSDTRYRSQSLSVLPGDRLFIVSDGLHNARNAKGEVYGQVPLGAALRSARLQDPNETVRFLIGDLLAYQEGPTWPNDAIAVCLDWTGTSMQPIAAASGNVTGFIRPGGHVT